MHILPIACLEDNYAYLVVCEATAQAAVVDPSEAEPVLAAIKSAGVTLTAIWNTHHHWDHTGGNQALTEAYPGIDVVAHASDRGRIFGQTVFADDGADVRVGTEVSARIIHNPGHTTGAISYFISAEPAVFTGDTLFCSGCGRLFEGTPAMMHASLSRLAALPGDTQVFCGHEYTVSNLAFAAAVEPDSAAIADRARWAKDRRRHNLPTVPSTLTGELATNPFLRTGEAEVKAACKNRDGDSPEAIFAALRSWKDRF